MDRNRFTIILDEEQRTFQREHRALLDDLSDLLSQLSSPLEAWQQFIFLDQAALPDGRGAVLLIWKGGATPHAKNRRFGGARLFVQWLQVAESTAIVTPLELVHHDDYDRGYRPTFPCVPTAEIPVIDHGAGVEIARAARLAWSLTPSFAGGSVEQPAFVRPSTVRSALRTGERTIDADSRRLAITQHRSGITITTNTGERPASHRLRYPLAALDSDEAIGVLDEHLKSPATNPAVMLSTDEEQFLDSFGKGHHLPAIIDGSAGSGKTTILGAVMLDLVARSALDASLPLPLFVTFNGTLLRTFRTRLKNALVVFHAMDEVTADHLAAACCVTLDDLVSKALGIPTLRGQQPGAARDYRTFSKWWTSGSENSYRYGGAHMEDTYRLLRQHVLGRMSFVEDGHFVWGANAKRALTLLLDAGVDEALAERLLATLEAFGRATTASGVHLFAESVHRAFRIVASDREHADRGIVVIDEAQDLTEIEIEFALAHSSLTSSAPLIGHGSGKARPGYVPLIIAGDELQTVIPSGFSFSGASASLSRHAAIRGLDLRADVIFRQTLTENFRSGTSLVAFGDAARRIRSAGARPSVPRRQERGQVLRLGPTAIPPEMGIDVLVPRVSALDSEGNEAAPTASETVRGWNEIPIDLAKGNEFPVVVMKGFGAALLDAQRRSSEIALDWTRNALSVAATRARDALYISETDEGFECLRQHFATVGYDIGTLEIVDQIALTGDQIHDLLDLRLDRAIRERSLEHLLQLDEQITRHGGIEQRLRHSAWLSALDSGRPVPWSRVALCAVDVRDELIEYLVTSGNSAQLTGEVLTDFTRRGRFSASNFAVVVVANLEHSTPDEVSLLALAEALSRIPAETWPEATDDLAGTMMRWVATPPGRPGTGAAGLQQAWSAVAEEALTAGQPRVAELATICALPHPEAQSFIESIVEPAHRDQLLRAHLQRSFWWLTEDAHTVVRARLADSKLVAVGDICMLEPVLASTSGALAELMAGGSLERLAVAALLDRQSATAVKELDRLLTATSAALNRHEPME